MKQKTVGKKTKIWLTYFEWKQSNGVLPPPDSMCVDGYTEYIITEVPEDKKEYFESLGLTTRLTVNKGKGGRIRF